VSLTTRIISEFSSVDALDWAGLDHADNPFLSHAFLAGLESSGSIGSQTGWLPHHLAVFENEQLAAFAPSYIKTHSHGEFVFDWAWADAYQRNGLQYYPKLLTAIPYSPVSGPRLLTRRDHPDPEGLRKQLLDFALSECEVNDFSSWHCNFVQGQDLAVLEDARPLLRRKDWQFHWHNEQYRDFDDFLDKFRSRKRKNIRRERRQVRESGIQFRRISGSDLQGTELEFVYRCYISTFKAYGNHPALRKEFFSKLASHLRERFLVVLASRDDEAIAMALFLVGGGRLYGRYWGCTENIPGLHFEVAYYQGIEYCIERGINVFESGAQGEHKISRGFQPAQTHSFHHVRERIFREAIAEHLSRENSWLDEYREQLSCQDPFRREPQ
jgi:predicted N-acyltransferase